MPEIPELEAADGGPLKLAAEKSPAAAGRPRDIAPLDRPSAGGYLKHTERTFFARLVAE